MTFNMGATIAPKSDQINADDLIGGPLTITVTHVSGNEGSPEQPVNVSFDGDGGKPFRPCKSMRRVMVAVWGPDAATYVGRSMTLYRDPEVAFGGMKVGGIRISHMSHIDKPMTMALTATRAQRKPYTVKPLTVQKAAPAIDPAAILESARAAARRGSAAFTAYWNSDEGKVHRDTLREHIGELKDLVDEADAASEPPFAETDRLAQEAG